MPLFDLVQNTVLLRVNLDWTGGCESDGWIGLAVVAVNLERQS